MKISHPWPTKYNRPCHTSALVMIIVVIISLIILISQTNENELIKMLIFNGNKK